MGTAHTQGMQVHIKRHELYADVTIIAADGVLRLSTTLNRGIQETDKKIKHLKRRMMHIQKPEEEK